MMVYGMVLGRVEVALGPIGPAGAGMGELAGWSCGGGAVEGRAGGTVRRGMDDEGCRDRSL